MDHGSVSRAAEWLGIAQPALSPGVGPHGKDLGVRLFERSRLGAPAGGAGHRRGRARQRGPHRRRRAARREIARGSAGQLTVGLVTSALFDTLPRAPARTAAPGAGVKVVLREMSNAEQAQALQDGGIDIGLMHAGGGGRAHARTPAAARAAGGRGARRVRMDPDGQTSLARIAQAGLVMYRRRSCLRSMRISSTPCARRATTPMWRRRPTAR